MEIGKKEFKTPFLIASSDLISTKEQAEEVLKYGKNMIGSIVWKTTTLEPREGYKEPIVCDFYDGFLVASGMKNLGIHKTILEIKDFKKKFPEQSIILSIASVNFDNPVKEFSDMTKLIRDIPIDGVELNLSCPHQVSGEKYKTELLAQNPEMVGKITKVVKDTLYGTDKILIAKLTGWNADIVKVCKVAENNGADAITVSNIFPGMGYYTGLTENKNGYSYKVGEPLLGNFKGGYTGVAMLPATLLIVNNVVNSVNIPVIATGGCMSSNDAMIQAFLAGASAIASATFYYDSNCRTCRDFSSDLIERKEILEKFVKEKIVNI